MRELAQILYFFLLPIFMVCSSCPVIRYHSVPTQRVFCVKNPGLLKIKPIELGYTAIHPEPVMEHLVMIGTVDIYGGDNDTGRILRALRYKNVADAVEARYFWMPKGTILAMMAHESGGSMTVPNSSNDGGVGGIHMQPMLAEKFGLCTYGCCTLLVCRPHGSTLRSLIEKDSSGGKRLVVYDDRFHPVLDLDAVGRMLTVYSCGNRIPGLTAYETSIRRYSGRWNYTKYLLRVEKFRSWVLDTAFISRLESRFNELNPELTIDGKRSGFKEYLEATQLQNENYGLREYKLLGACNF